jgi:hypothetical protein
MVLEFKTQTSKKPKCSKGYPCGGGCISRQNNCQKKLKGQASDFAGWLKQNGSRNGRKDSNGALQVSIKGGSLALITKARFEKQASLPPGDVSSASATKAKKNRSQVKAEFGDPKEDHFNENGVLKDDKLIERKLILIQLTEQKHRSKRRLTKTISLKSKNMAMFTML